MPGRSLFGHLTGLRSGAGAGTRPRRPRTEGPHVVQEIAIHLGRPIDDAAIRLTRSLVATVHGHCVLALGGSLALMGERDPVGLALDRVRDALR